MTESSSSGQGKARLRRDHIRITLDFATVLASLTREPSDHHSGTVPAPMSIVRHL